MHSGIVALLSHNGIKRFKLIKMYQMSVFSILVSWMLENGVSNKTNVIRIGIRNISGYLFTGKKYDCQYFNSY